MRVITLTTDFGTSDGYVGAMKGVIARSLGFVDPPSVTVVDIAHEIPRGDIAHAAWVVATACTKFPAGTIHVVVVDPGVGGARRGVVVESGDSYYVGPDNGTFGYLAITEVRAIDTARLVGAANVSPTFHGRDVFAPVAAGLARGVDPSAVGSVVTLEHELPWGPRPQGEGRIVHVDHFGNLISDLPASEAGEAVAIAGRRFQLARTYEDVPTGELLAYIGSQRTVEIAVRDGRADRVLAAPRGTPIVPVTGGSEYR